MKKLLLIVILVTICLLLIACDNKSNEINQNNYDTERDENILNGNKNNDLDEELKTDQNSPLAKVSEYTLLIDNINYEINSKVPDTDLFTIDEITEFEAQFPFPASKQYSKKRLCISTFINDNESEQSEKLYYICTTEKGRTMRGIGIGDSLENLRKAYPELIYHNRACGNGMEMVKFNRLYSFYIPEDQTNNYINFYLENKKIVMIEIADGLDAPREWCQPEPILGDENLFSEIISDKPGETHIDYFLVNEDGTEETVIDVYSMTEEHDLDGDGINEIIVYLPGKTKGIGIYDMVNGKLDYIDINEKLGASWSEYMGNIGNINHEYENCIEVAFENDDGISRYEVYRVKDNVLTYVCTFDEALQ